MPSPPARILVLDGRTPACLPVIKALHQAGHHLTIGESTPRCVGFFSRYPQQRLRYRDIQRDPDGFLKDLVGHLATGNYDVLLPLVDVTATLLCQHKKYLEKFVRLPLPDYPIFMRARDKSKTMKIAQAHGLPCPRTYFPGDTGVLGEIAKTVEYPVLIKPNLGRGGEGLTKVGQPSELLKLYPRIVARYGPCSIQEYIPQTDMQYKAQIFLDRDSEIKACVVYSKIRYYPVEGGFSALNCTVDRPDIAEIGIKLLKALEWSSYGDVDLISDPRDGLVKIMEVNPRVTGSVKICFEAGVDFADMLVAYALGHEVTPVKEYRTGIYLRNLWQDILWFFKSKERFTTRPSWFWFFGKQLKYDGLSFSDPGASVGHLALLASALVKRLLSSR